MLKSLLLLAIVFTSTKSFALVLSIGGFHKDPDPHAVFFRAGINEGCIVFESSKNYKAASQCYLNGITSLSGHTGAFEIAIKGFKECDKQGLSEADLVQCYRSAILSREFKKDWNLAFPLHLGISLLGACTNTTVPAELQSQCLAKYTGASNVRRFDEYLRRCEENEEEPQEVLACQREEIKDYLHKYGY